MATATKTRLKTLEKANAPQLASKWFRDAFVEPSNDKEMLDFACVFVEEGVFIPLDQRAQEVMQEHRARREAEYQTWPVCAPEEEEAHAFYSTVNAIGVIRDVFDQTPCEFLAPDGRENVGDLLRGQLCELREEAQEWDTNCLLGFAHALKNFVLKENKTKFVDDIPMPKFRQWIADWKPI